MKKFILSVLCAATMSVFSSAFFCFADETQPASQTQAQSGTQAPSESDASAITPVRTDGDPLSETDDKEIPLSFYICGGVLVVFVLASSVVLIIGKKQKK